MDIKTYRKAKGMSQAQFAAALSAVGPPATQSLVSQWECGGTGITPDRASQIELATKGEISRIELIFGSAPDCPAMTPDPQSTPTKAEAA